MGIILMPFSAVIRQLREFHQPLFCSPPLFKHHHLFLFSTALFSTILPLLGEVSTSYPRWYCQNTTSFRFHLWFLDYSSFLYFSCHNCSFSPLIKIFADTITSLRTEFSDFHFPLQLCSMILSTQPFFLISRSILIPMDKFTLPPPPRLVVNNNSACRSE